MKCVVYITLILSTFLLLFIGLYGSSQDIRMKMEHLNQYLIGHELDIMTGLHHHMCIQHCLSLKACISTDFIKSNATCKLNDVNISSVDPSEILHLPGAIYSDIERWPSTMVGSCGSRPCKINEKCHPGYDMYRCEELDCGKPVIKHGKMILSAPEKTKFRDTATVQCREGYAPSQSSVKCLLNTSWEMASCKEIDCGNPTLIQNGTITLSAPDKTKHRDTASVQCDLGFVPSQSNVTCLSNSIWENVDCIEATDCKDIIGINQALPSGVYNITLWQSRKVIQVYCDMDKGGGGWTVFQNRFDGTIDFFRGIQDYRDGFGSIDGEFWLGLNNIREIANQSATDLRYDLTRDNGTTGYRIISDFRLEGDDFILRLGNILVTEGFVATVDDMKDDEGNGFTTHDYDIDGWAEENCAHDCHGAWWYYGCTYVNLNGLYYTDEHKVYIDAKLHRGIFHYGFSKMSQLATSTMMIRRA